MRNCIILGSGRSGTSMVAGCLAGSGYFLGDDLMPANEQNPKGYYESYKIEAINEELLSQVLPKRPKGWLGDCFYSKRLGKSQRWLAELNDKPDFVVDKMLIERMQSQVKNKPYCFKDPRFSYTLSAWDSVFEDVLFLVVFREPGRTINSIIKTIENEEYLNNLKLSRADLTSAWAAQYESLLKNEIDKGDWIFVHYDQIINGSIVSKLEMALDASIDLSFSEKNLKRSSDASVDSRRANEVYKKLCNLARHQENGC